MPSIIIILLLCISLLHSSDGRNLRVEMNEGHKKQFQYLYKENNQNARITSSRSVDPSLLNKLDQETERDSAVKQIRVNDDHIPKKIDFEAIREEMKIKKVLRSKDGVHNDHGSLASVSFRVPRNNERLDHHPGFNLDYAPPKTYPPIHN